MGPLERLILCWAAARDDEQFSERDLLEGLGRTIPSLKLIQVNRALNYMTATYLLIGRQEKYWFYTPLLRRKMREVQDLDYLMSVLIREFRNTQGRG